MIHIDNMVTDAGPGLPPAELAACALSAVLRGAATGRLPPFVWTLDLPQERLLALIAEHLPDMLTAVPLFALHHATLRRQVPPEFRNLLSLLLDSRAATAASAVTERVARTLAAACFGSRHLWQDLGLSGRDDVSLLLATYFPALHQANVRNLKWKRFLFAELSVRHGGAECLPPNCTRCDDFPGCFPDRAQTGERER